MAPPAPREAQACAVARGGLVGKTHSHQRRMLWSVPGEGIKGQGWSWSQVSVLCDLGQVT